MYKGGLFILAMLMSFALQAKSATLQEVMKEMGANLRPIAQAVQSGRLDPAIIGNIQTLAQAVNQATDLLPVSVAGLPQSDQRGATIRYQKLMLELHLTILSLEESVVLGDLAKSQTLLQKMLDLRAQGHQEFRLGSS